MMTRILLALAAGVAAMGSLAASAPAPLGPPPAPGTGLAQGQCVVTADIQNHVVVDKNTLLVDVSGRNDRSGGATKGLYRLTMRNGCLSSAVTSDPISFNQAGRGKLCGPKDLGLVARGGVCAIDSVVKLTPEEVAGLPRKLRP